MAAPTKIKVNTGDRFGALVVLRKNGYRKHHLVWDCQCDCGKILPVFDTNIKRGLSSHCPSCGVKEGGKKLRTHGRSRNDKTYAAWSKMKRRCLNPESDDYYLYGARGITVHPLWVEYFVAFAEHVGLPPSQKHSIDRIDTNGNYEPGNVKWSTAPEQANNKRNNRKVEFNGEKISMRAASEITGIKRATIRSLAAKHGATVEQMIAFTSEKRFKNQPFSDWKSSK